MNKIVLTYKKVRPSALWLDSYIVRQNKMEINIANVTQPSKRVHSASVKNYERVVPHVIFTRGSLGSNTENNRIEEIENELGSRSVSALAFT